MLMLMLMLVARIHVVVLMTMAPLPSVFFQTTVHQRHAEALERMNESRNGLLSSIVVLVVVVGGGGVVLKLFVGNAKQEED
jgi:hypothetical protein